MPHSLEDLNRRKVTLRTSKVGEVLPEYFSEENPKLITFLVVCVALGTSIEVTSIFNVFLVADLFAACLVFPAFYKIKKSSKDIFLIVPFVGSLISVYLYRYLFIDLQVNPGGIFFPTDLYGLADLNTFAIGLLSSMVITLVADKAIK